MPRLMQFGGNKIKSKCKNVNKKSRKNKTILKRKQLTKKHSNKTKKHSNKTKNINLNKKI